MARSGYTYAVLSDDGRPLAGFTVKHELVTWLRRQGAGVELLEVWRCRDGLEQRLPVELDVDELLREAP